MLEWVAVFVSGGVSSGIVISVVKEEASLSVIIKLHLPFIYNSPRCFHASGNILKCSNFVCCIVALYNEYLNSKCLCEILPVFWVWIKLKEDTFPCCHEWKVCWEGYYVNTSPKVFCLPGEAEHSDEAGEKTRVRITPPPLFLYIPPPPRFRNFPFLFARFLRLVPHLVIAAGFIGGTCPTNTVQIFAYSILCHNKMPNIQRPPALRHHLHHSIFLHCTLIQPSLRSTHSIRLPVTIMGSIVTLLSLRWLAGKSASETLQPFHPCLLSLPVLTREEKPEKTSLGAVQTPVRCSLYQMVGKTFFT